VVFALSLGIAIAIGIIAASVQIAVQKGSAVVWLLGSAIWFLTGTLFPVDSLPRALQTVASIIPLTHALTAMRLALVQGTSMHVLIRELVILTSFCALFLPLSLILFSYTLRRARMQGTLSFY
jgi:ABC-2 type transport system permease protein